MIGVMTSQNNLCVLGGLCGEYVTATFRFTSTLLSPKFKSSPNSHDNIPSILSKNLRALRGE